MQNWDYPLSKGCGADFTLLTNFLCVLVKISDRLGTLSAFSAVGRIVNSPAKMYLTAESGVLCLFNVYYFSKPQKQKAESQ